jgi:nucleotide-binding universal stress UspA family protein
MAGTVSRNVLVVVDGSAASRQALERAIELAQQGGGRLTILTPVLRPPAWVTTPMTAVACGPLARELERDAASALEAARDAVPHDVPLTTILTERPVCEAVLARLGEHPHDLLVLAAGRPARRLARRSPVPVLAVPEGAPAPNPTTGSVAPALLPAVPAGPRAVGLPRWRSST